MQNFLSFAALSGVLLTLAWSYVAQPLPPDNAKAFRDCIKLHPAKYCRSEYLPSTIAWGSDGRR